MSKLKALLLTQGMHGMISQVEGLAKALNLNYKNQEIKLKKFWEFIPPFLTPTTLSVLETNFIFDSESSHFMWEKKRHTINSFKEKIQR